MADPIDTKVLLSKLDKLEPETDEQSFDDLMRQISMAGAMPAITEINHEKEYLICRRVAEHLIGEVHQPEAYDVE